MMKEDNKKEPMNTGDLFCRLYEHLLEQHKIPNILEYNLPVSASERVPIVTNDFDVLFHLNYGGSEGIYLDVYIRGAVTCDDVDETYSIGTFKTLEEDDCSMRTMALLGADLICEGRRYIRENRDDFQFTGYQILLYSKDEDENDKQVFCPYTVASQKGLIPALERWFEDPKITEKHNITKAVIRNNRTRREMTISKEEFLHDKTGNALFDL